MLLIDILAQALEFHEEVSELVREALEAIVQICELFCLGGDFGGGAVGNCFGNAGEGVVMRSLVVVVSEILMRGILDVCVVPVLMTAGDDHSVELKGVWVLLSCGGRDTEVVAFWQTDAVGVEAVLAINLHDESTSFLAHELQFTRHAQVAILVITLPESQTLRVGLRAEVFGSIVQEPTNLSSRSTILIDHQRKSIESLDIVDTVHSNFAVFGIPKLEISRTDILPGSAELEGCGKVGGGCDVFGPKSSFGISRVWGSEDETIGEMLDFVVDVGDLVAGD